MMFICIVKPRTISDPKIKEDPLSSLNSTLGLNLKQLNRLAMRRINSYIANVADLHRIHIPLCVLLHDKKYCGRYQLFDTLELAILLIDQMYPSPFA